MLGIAFFFCLAPIESLSSTWNHEDIGALDLWGDQSDSGLDGVALYAKVENDKLVLRLDLLDLRFNGQATPGNTPLKALFAIDFEPGGRIDLGPRLPGVDADLAWDLLVEIKDGNVQGVFDTELTEQPGLISDFVYDGTLDYIQFAIPVAALAGWSPPDELGVQVITTNSATDTVADRVPDAADLPADILTATTGRAKLVIRFLSTFIGYGPNAISWYDGYDLTGGEDLRPGELRGYKYLLDAFERHGLPLVLNDLRIDLLFGTEHLNINERLRGLIDSGVLEITPTTSYGHFMPWHPSDVNAKALELVHDSLEAFDFPISNLFYPYEAKLRIRDLDTITAAGFDYIDGYDLYRYIVDDWITDWSCGGIDFEDCNEMLRERIESAKKIHRINGINFVFDSRIGNYQGALTDPRWGSWVWPASEAEFFAGTDNGLHLGWRRILMDQAADPDQEKFFTIGTDFTLTTWMYPDIVDANVEWIAEHPWIEVVTFSDLLGRGWTPVDHGDLGLSPDDPLERFPQPNDGHYNAYFWDYYYGGVSDGHSPIIPEGQEIEGYFDYVPYLKDGALIPSGRNMGDDVTPGSMVYETLQNLRSSPDNPITELAWRLYFTTTEEQVGHAPEDFPGGAEISDGWGGPFLHPRPKMTSNYLGQTNKLIAAAKWADKVKKGQISPESIAYSDDLDLDGEQEFVLRNDKVFTVFENDGGKLEFGFAVSPWHGPIQVVSPIYQHDGPGVETGWDFKDGETALRRTFDIWDAGFVDVGVEQNFLWTGYAYETYAVSVGTTSLTFTSPDGRISKVLSLDGDTVRGSYSVSGLNSVRIGFGLSVNTSSMFSRDWTKRIHPVQSAGERGWLSDDGGYAAVDFEGTQFAEAHSFLDSPAPEEMFARADVSTYPLGHWHYFPHHTVAVTGTSNFAVSLTLKTGGESGDADQDGIPNGEDIYPLDTDNDGLDNDVDTDDDNDGLLDATDNCPLVANLGQENTDGDAEGDACDEDDDNDGLSDVDEVAAGWNPLVNEPAAAIQIIDSILLGND